ncbi:ferrochelatase [Corynebacterium kutscheri]|uniref:Coproporphyrin III ferrochelatase n=1 Tax=Corynebacterium kutscheri TaxID=35755 RepID=A0AB38VSR0_9CORY|nr:ferrochelatase [Corynebacterium kutscheri]VEH08522.1 ferrochelatase [Corynebacterium kutscheri]VEH79651.1 ferrochelatase [Corynebacterium kutscheri]
MAFTAGYEVDKAIANLSVENIDALLVLSFGGPERPEDVRPFLENVTRGRGIPAERLDEVAVHYHHFGGKSPLNDLNREIIANVEKELHQRGLSIPVYFGNRNWHPYANDVAERMYADGHRTIAVLATSAWGGYSGCRQYGEDIIAMLNHLAHTVGTDEPLHFIRLRQFFDHPKFIDANVQAVNEAFAQVTPGKSTRLVFTAHSIPVLANTASGTSEDGTLYSNQVYEAARLVAERAQAGAYAQHYDLVWQSASGDGKIAWLEPDILDFAQEVREKDGDDAIVVCSIGFISDHMEVVWDLDNELQYEAQKMGLEVVRARTIGPSTEFAEMVVDIIDESLNPQKALHLGTVVSKGCTYNGAPCQPECCQPARRKPPVAT